MNPSLARMTKSRCRLSGSSVVSAGRSTTSTSAARWGEALAQRLGVRGEHHPPPGPHQQRIAGGVAQPRERPAHGRGREAEPPRGVDHAALVQQGVERAQKVQIASIHGPSHAPSRLCRQTGHGVRCSNSM
jgi:hypothetical protein